MSILDNSEEIGRPAWALIPSLGQIWKYHTYPEQYMGIRGFVKLWASVVMALWLEGMFLFIGAVIWAFTFGTNPICILITGWFLTLTPLSLVAQWLGDWCHRTGRKPVEEKTIHQPQIPNPYYDEGESGLTYRPQNLSNRYQGVDFRTMDDE